MSSLVTEFLIEPVLRQARRFSRSSNSSDTPHHNSIWQQPWFVSSTQPENGLTEGDAENDMESSRASRQGDEDLSSGLLGEAQISPPVSEDTGFESALRATTENGQLQNGDGDATASVRVPGAAMARSSQMSLDQDINNSPSSRVPNRLRRSADMNTNSSSRSAIHNFEAVAAGPTGDISSSSIGLDSLQQATNRSSTRPVDTSLPEDDGMKAMRQKIVEIRDQDISAEEKARLMHHLFTEKYNQSLANLLPGPLPRPHSPASLISQDRPFTPNSMNSGGGSWQEVISLGSAHSVGDPESILNVTDEDRKRTYVPESITQRNSLSGDGPSDEEWGSSSEPVLGCQHYKRNVKLQCSSCSRWYTCRFCHDNAEDHVLNRKQTKNMLCMICGCAQKAGETCIQCHERTAWYYCNICKLWDDDTSKSIYHCNDCGICRVGHGLGKDFFHCKVQPPGSFVAFLLIVCTFVDLRCMHVNIH
jgi:hypothetical protein